MLKKTLYTGVAFLALGAGIAKADIIIGVAGPLTGQYATFGEQGMTGVKQGVADINAAGGINGEKVVLEVGDDACDPKQAVAVANQFAHKGVSFVIGHFCSGSSIPASAVYAEEGINMVSYGSTNPALTDAGNENVFRVCGRDDQQGPTAAKMLHEKFKGKRIAVLQDKTAYGKGLADEMLKALHKLGDKEVMYEAYTAGEKDYSALVTKLKQAKIDVIFLGGYHSEGGLILRQAHEQGLKATLVGGDALGTSEFAAIAGEASDGTLFSFNPDPRKNPANDKIVEKIRATGYEPEGYTLYGYAATQIFAQAVAAKKSSKPEVVEKALHSMKFDTVLGNVSFDKKGDLKAPGFIFYEWKDGNFDYVK